MTPIVKQFKYGQHTVTLETGAIARQATAAVMASMDDTTVFVTVVAKRRKRRARFLPINRRLSRAYLRSRSYSGRFLQT